jgi:YD repeat-containing protein
MTIDPTTNRIAMSGFAYDAAGNLTQQPDGGGTDTFTYDSQNRLSGVSSTSYAPYATQSSILYDARGRRISDGGNNGTTWSVYGPDGQELGVLGGGGGLNGFTSFAPERGKGDVLIRPNGK